jgi:hypothetical protein
MREWLMIPLQMKGSHYGIPSAVIIPGAEASVIGVKEDIMTTLTVHCTAVELRETLADATVATPPSFERYRPSLRFHEDN